MRSRSQRRVLGVRLLAAAGAVALTGLVSSTAAGQVAPAGLVAAYGFEEGGGLGAGDSSGTGNVGSVAGATWTSGRHGGGLSFDGLNDRVTIPDATSLDLTTGMTLEAWVNPRTLPSASWRSILLKERGTNLAYALYANSSTNVPSGDVFIGADRKARGTTQLALNAWTHLAVTYSGSALRLYVNGTQVGTRAQTGSIAGSTGPLSIGGNAVWGEWFDGLIDDVRVYNRALSAAELGSDMGTPVGSPPAPEPDVVPPSVSVTAPADGTTVSGTIDVSASASDDVGVADVQFVLDGDELGAADTTAPYSVSWDTTGVTNGSHTLWAVASDGAGNETISGTVLVDVDNSGPPPPGPSPAEVGQWSEVMDWPLVGVHASVLPTGKVLVWDGFGPAVNSERIWDPATRTFVGVPYGRNLFCSGHVTLADGRKLIVGGHITSYNGLADATLFDPATGTWERGADMARGRWYPTATTLPDGRVLVVSGDNITRGNQGQPTPLINSSDTLPEIYEPAAGTWTALPSAGRIMPLYPFMFVLPDGRIFDAGPDTQTRTLDLSTGIWSPLAVSPIDGHSAVMYRPGRILKSGTWADPDFPGRPIDNRAAVIDTNSASPEWREIAPMAFPRAYHNLTVLPDGTVLNTSGGRTSDGKDLTNGVHEAELWNPETESWRTLSAGQVSRLYHSTSLVLPDGRVLVTGGGRITGATNQLNAEIFSPPYLFKGPRPSITSAPATIVHGAGFTVDTPEAASIASVALLRSPSMTHNFDQDQRYISLTFTRAAGRLNADAPANANIAPPGTYMLFVVDANGVPSLASFVRMPVPGNQDTSAPTVSVTAPADGASVSGTVDVTATAGDDVGVVGVQFKLGAVDLGAEDTTAPYSVSWSSTTAANGPATLTAIARDAAGNRTTSSPVTVTVANTAPPPPAGLVAAYGFEEAGGTAVGDSSGTGNGGSVAGATWASGRHGGGLSFDGLNDMVTIPDAASLDLTTGMTLEAWVNPRTLPSASWRTILLKERGNHLAYALYANSSTNRPSGHVYISGDRSARGTSQLALNAWTHVAVTFDGSVIRLYVNGTQVGTRTQAGSIAVSTNVLRIGGNAVWGEWFDGLIDDVRVYNRALSAAELGSDMTRAVG